MLHAREKLALYLITNPADKPVCFAISRRPKRAILTYSALYVDFRVFGFFRVFSGFRSKANPTRPEPEFFEVHPNPTRNPKFSGGFGSGFGFGHPIPGLGSSSYRRLWRNYFRIRRSLDFGAWPRTNYRKCPVVPFLHS